MRHIWLRSLLFLLDFAVLEVAFFGIYWWRFQTGMFVNPVTFTLPEVLVPSLFVSAFWILHFAIFGLYRFDPLESRAAVFVNCTRAAVYGCLIIFIATFDPVNPLPVTRVILLTYGVGVMAGIAFTRLLLLTILQELRMRGFIVLPAVVVGSGEPLADVLHYLSTNKALGAKILGIVGQRHSGPTQWPLLGGVSRIRNIISDNRCELVYIALGEKQIHQLSRIVSLLAATPVRQFLPAEHYQYLLGEVKPIGRRGQVIIEIRRDLLTPVERILKRLFDIVASFTLLIITLPIWILAAVAILIDSGRPIFYLQTRVGHKGKHFRMIKFRSMIPDAESRTGPVLVTKGDSRITRIGKYLRSTRIDELPQLVNVLLGQMSLVGPRPERPEFIDEFARTSPLFLRRLNVKPGLTGWAQVHLQYDATIFAPAKKLEMDLYYIENMSVPLDLKILFMTMFVVLRGEG